MKKLLLITGLTLSATFYSAAQVASQKIGTNPTIITPSAALEVESTNKGVLVPRVALTGTTDATTIASPATSLLVYNTATAGTSPNDVTPGFYYWNGSAWVRLASGNTLNTEVDGVIGNEVLDAVTNGGLTRTGTGTALDPYKLKISDGTTTGQVLTWDGSKWAAQDSSADWKLTGNAGTTAGTNFIGTTDAVDLVTKTNNAEVMRVTSTGNVGIGTTTPAAKLDVNADALINGVTVGRGTGNVSGNTAVGASALGANTTGNYNTANGVTALRSNTTGNYNTANGVTALRSNTTGDNNTANGVNALYSNTTGNNNTANGVNALSFNTTGTDNTANGVNALYSNTTGNNNTANGSLALYDNTTGDKNTAIGYDTGRGITTGRANTILGASVTGLAAGLSNNIIIADGDGNQRINVDATGNVGIGTTTPGAKLDVNGNVIGQDAKFRQIDLYHDFSPNPERGFIDFKNNANEDYDFRIAEYSNGNLAIIGNGNVGIGTTTPGAKLEINNGTTAGALKIVDGTQGENKVLTSDANGVATWKNQSSTNGTLIWSGTVTCRYVPNSTYIRIDLGSIPASIWTQVYDAAGRAYVYALNEVDGFAHKTTLWAIGDGPSPSYGFFFNDVYFSSFVQASSIWNYQSPRAPLPNKIYIYIF